MKKNTDCVKCQAWQDIIADEMACTKQIIDAMDLHDAIAEGQAVQDAILAFIARARRIEKAASKIARMVGNGDGPARLVTSGECAELWNALEKP